MAETAPVIGHRGACGHAPENTRASLRAAARLGARWVEVDATLSRDKIAFLFHDDTLERTTDGTGPAGGEDWARLARLDAGDWFGREFRGERLLRLDDAVAELAALDLGANIEIKPGPDCDAETGRAVAEVLRACWPAGRIPPLLSSFSEIALDAARAVAPRLPRALLVERVPADWSARLARLDSRDLHAVESGLAPATVATIRAAGAAVRAYTVNDPARARALFAIGVAAVFTDFPERIAPPPPG